MPSTKAPVVSEEEPITHSVGIDLSTQKISIATIHIQGNDLSFSMSELKSRKRDWLERLHDLQEQFWGHTATLNKKSILVIEDIAYVVNKQSYYKLVSVLAMLRTVLYQNEIPYTVMHNSTWKKHAGVFSGPKRKDIKERIRIRAYKIFGDAVNGLNQDETDALLIGYAGIKERTNGR